jgi:PAS domain-containing protein
MPPGNVDKTAQVSRAGVLPDYAVEADRERRYTKVSEGFCKVLGYTRRELIGKRVDEITAKHIGLNSVPQTFKTPVSR